MVRSAKFGFILVIFVVHQSVKTMIPIRTIVFDLGGVLIDYDLPRCLEAFRRLGLAEPARWINSYKQSGVFLTLENGSGKPEDLYRYLSDQVGHPLDPRSIDEAWCSFLLDIPDYKLDMLRSLRRQGYQVFMLSNTNVIMFDWMRRTVFTKQGGTLMDYFDRVFLSYEMKLVKPDPAIFEQMARDGGISPEETLLIDDSAANVATAASLGFHTYQAQVHEDFRSLFDRYTLKP